MVATLWINLAPPSIIPLSYEAILGLTPMQIHATAAHAPLLGRAELLVYELIYYTFWGSAGLLFALVAAITLGYTLRRELEFAESWWAFVFPLAAYSISSIHGYFAFHEESLLYFSCLLYLLAWATYAATTAFSLRTAWRRTRENRSAAERGEGLHAIASRSRSTI